MAALRVNILTNYAGQIWIAVMGVAFLPLYIRILGMEAFGMIGLMLTIQSISQLFDFGIGGAANRELSQRTHNPALVDGARDFIRTAELVIWVLTVVIGLTVWAASGLAVDYWLNLQTVTPSEAKEAIAIMGVAIALLWPNAFYANCLSGLEQQPLLNVINAIFATLRSAGALGVLLWISPTVKAFLWWYAIVGMAQSLATAIAVWNVLPRGNRHARWAHDEFRKSGHFAGGLFLIGVLAMGVGQLDRLSIATLRPLAELGYYTLALSVAAGLGRMVVPMFNALYPRFSRLVVREDKTGLRELYHLSSQCSAVVIAAAAAVLIFFAHDVLFIWTGDANLADKLRLPMAILVTGSALNGLMSIPFALQLAHGWTRLAIVLNCASLLVGIPFCVWAVPQYGMNGAACLWLIANLVSISAGIPAMHRRLLRGEMLRWYLSDTLPPILAAVSVTLIFRMTLSPLSRSADGFAVLGIVSIATLVASALASKAVREMMRARISTN